jgi:hypothetical protein
LLCLDRFNLDRLAPGRGLAQERLELAAARGRQLVEQRHVSGDEVAFGRIKAPPQFVKAAEGLAVHLQRQDEGRFRR